MKGNLLKLQDLDKNNEWCDKDRVMLYACFQLLVDFIEKEKPQTIVDYKHEPTQRKEWQEMQALYHYWKKDRPKLQRKVDRLLAHWSRKHKTKWVPLKNGNYEYVVVKTDNKAWKLPHQAEDQFEKQEDEMLLRLINIRRRLWC